MGFEQAFFNPSFKRMDALKKMIQYLIDYFLDNSYWIRAISS